MPEGATRVTSLASQFFNKPFVDEKFTSVQYIPVQPTSDYTSQQTIEFQIPKYNNASAILMDGAMIEVNLRLLNSRGEIPGQAKAVSFSNNIVNSLFKECHITINGVQNITHASNYMYRALLQTVFTTDSKF